MRRFLSNYILPLAVFIACIVIIPKLVVTDQVSGTSMEPTLANGQKILVQKDLKIQRGDIIVFNALKEDPAASTAGAEHEYYVKRVIAVAGDTVKNTAQGLYVNNKKVNESYISTAQQSQDTGYWTLNSLSRVPKQSGASTYWADPVVNDNKVPAGEVFVMGDNRMVSEDSRYFGFVAVKHIVGVVHTFPFSTSGDPTAVNGDVAKNYFVNASSSSSSSSQSNK